MLIEVLERLFADTFVTHNHVNQQDIEHHYLKDEVEPGHIAQDCDEAGEDAGIEGEDVGVLHQRQAEFAEVVAEVLLGHSILAVALVDCGTQALHVGCHSLLVGGITQIEEQGQFAPEVPAPLQLAILFTQLG